MRVYWHTFILWLFNKHFQDELTEAIHPDFGWIWREEEMGGKLLASAKQQGREEALRNLDKYIREMCK